MKVNLLSLMVGVNMTSSAQQQQQQDQKEQLDQQQQQDQKKQQDQKEKHDQKQQQDQKKQQDQQHQKEQRAQQQQQQDQQRYQQQLIEQQKQRLTQYRQYLNQQQHLEQQYAEQLQKQNRKEQKRYYQWYSEQLRQQQRHLENERDHDYNNDPYFFTAPNYRYKRGGAYYKTNQYGVRLLQQAVRYGYEEGFRAGRADRDDRWHSDYQGSYAYRDANYGYNGYYVSQDDYNHYFREGFRRGYEDAYNTRYVYGRNSNGKNSILENILVQILNLEPLR
jgi:acyl transferase domain-containing protein